MSRHSRVTGINVHVPHAFTYANAAARAAASGFDATDLYKLALQTDTNTLWLLTNTTSPAWVQVGGGGGGAALTIAEIDGSPSGAPTTLQFPNGTVADQGGGVYRYTPAPGALTLIAATDLAATAASVAFSAIPGTYRDLLIAAVARSTSGNLSDYLLLRANGDTGANYEWATFTSVGSGTAAAEFDAATSCAIGEAVGGGMTAGVAGSLQAEINGYAATTFTKGITGRSITRVATSDPGLRARVTSGFWKSAAAITALTLLPAAGSFAAGSRFALYGRN